MKRLADQTMLGNILMKNRFVRAAVGDFTNGGHLSENNYELYRNLADGGAALLMTGFSVVDAQEQSDHAFSLADDALIPEYRRLTQIVHEAGSRIAAQLVYLSGFVPVARPLAPSAGKNVYTGIETFEMTGDEIHRMMRLFADAARRAVEMGFDGVELHAAHGFLLHQFFSPQWNRRADDYGGSVENRSRFLIETYEAVRGAVGAGFPVMMKLSLDDVPADEWLYLARQLDARGIDALETSGNWMAHKPVERTYYHDAAAVLARELRCAIIQTGGNREFDALEQQLNSSGIDYFGFARPFMTEPDFVNKYLRGEILKPRCLSCNFCLRNPKNVCVFEKEKLHKDGHRTEANTI